MMARTQKQMQARDRVRQQRALLDRARAEQERRVDDAAVAFYDASAKRAVAERAVEEADEAMARAIGVMVELGQTNATIATLCELTEGEVRVLRKRASDLATPAAEVPLEGLDS